MKKTFLRFLTPILLSAFALNISAQDIHFSQFYMSPLNLNPAMTGVMNCNHRVAINYRNQWASILNQNAFNTFSASYDQRIAVGRYDYFGLGGTVWADKAGSLGFSTVQPRLSGSYAKKMGGYRRKAHYLSFGADLGFSNRNLNVLNAQWGSQHDGAGGFNPNLPQEIVDNPNFWFADMSAGLLWFSVFDEFNNFYIGGAFSHLNRANVSFLRENVPLYNKITLHAGGEFTIADRTSLLPGIVTFLQGPSFQVNGGTSFKFLLGNSRRYSQAFQLGAWARLSNRLDSKHLDAIILSTRFDYEQFTIGFSYDVNTSNLRAATNGNGAFEFSLLYKVCGPERRGVYCPNF